MLTALVLSGCETARGMPEGESLLAANSAWGWPFYDCTDGSKVEVRQQADGGFVLSHDARTYTDGFTVRKIDMAGGPGVAVNIGATTIREGQQLTCRISALVD